MLRETTRDDDGVWLVRGAGVMPFRSLSQRGFLYANHPELAAEFEAETPPGIKLPEHVGKRGESRDARAIRSLYPHLGREKEKRG